MNDQWYDFWVKQGAGYRNGTNLRPETYDYVKAAQYINRYLSVGETDNFLDVGCGNGQMIKQFREYTRFISGIDYSTNMVALSGNLLKNLPNTIGECFVARAEELIMFKDNCFDKIVCMAVLQYYSEIKYAKNALSELYRVCKKDGLIYVGDLMNKDIVGDQPVGMTSFSPKELADGYDYKIIQSYFEPHRRFDLLIKK